MASFIIGKKISSDQCVAILKKELTDKRIQNITKDSKGNPLVLTKALKFIVIFTETKKGVKVTIKSRWANLFLVMILICLCLFPMIIYSLVQAPTIKQFNADIQSALQKHDS